MKNDDNLWRRLQNRDVDSGPLFFYGVSTTGIYCRVGCCARQPRRENVTFFKSVEAAEKAGFRACKRCLSPTGLDYVVVQACRQLEDIGRPVNLSELARSYALSTSHFHRLFTQQVGLTPQQYGEETRRARLRDLLTTDRSVTEAAYEAGYGSSGQFYADSPKAVGMKPKNFSAGGPGELIAYTTTTTFLGRLLVAATERGICSVELGETATAETLKERFPQAELVSLKILQEWVDELLAATLDREALQCLPLDLQGSAFQKNVWQALREIPPGETRSYSQLAAELGKPTATRAVAGACASNRIALLVPCHRVVGKNGSLTGYRWGVERKETLLKRESAQPGALEMGENL